MVAIAAALVIRLAGAGPEAFDPRAATVERVALPEGESILAVGAAGEALILATRDAEGRERLRLFSAADGAPLRAIAIDRAAAAD